MNSVFDISTKIVLITGSTQGLGLTFAGGFAKAGATVIINSFVPVDNAVNHIESMGGKAKGYRFDVSKAEEVINNIELIEKEVGPIDVLINNAGIHRRAPFIEMTQDSWRQVIDINLNAVFTVTQAVAKGMIKRKKGRIINISSLNSVGARPTISNYCAAKGGINMLTRALASELGEYNINVNAIAPGYFITDLTQHLAEDEKFDSWVKSEVPLKRWGNKEELIGTAIFLASEASSYINGQVLFVDGGWRASL